MAFKQPKVPEYRESDGTDRYIRSLILFLKDFCIDAWTADRQRIREIGELEARLSRLEQASDHDENDEGGA